MGRAVLAYAFAILIFTSVSLARTWYVKDDGTGDVPTIQAGVDSASTGDEVVLANGTFTGDGNRDIDFDGKSLTIRSESGDPEACIIDCGGTAEDPHRGFYFHEGEGLDSRLSGLMIMNGVAAASSPGGNEGGAILCLMAGPNITDCIMASNQAFMGGGIRCGGAAAVIEDCVFVANSADVGAGVSVSVGDIVRNCTFVDHRPGIAIHCFGGSPMILNCTLYHNGGGVICELDGTNAIIENTIIVDCNRWPAVECVMGGEVALLCCNIYGNAPGDWIGCIADQYGVGGNISVGPSFCHPEIGDFQLCDESPCAPGNHPDSVDCGLIDAWGVGCVCGPSGAECSTWGGVKSLYW